MVKLNQRNRDDRKRSNSNQLASQTSHNIRQKTFIRELKSLASQVHPLVGTPPEERLQGHLALTQTDDFIL